MRYLSEVLGLLVIIGLVLSIVTPVLVSLQVPARPCFSIRGLLREFGLENLMLFKYFGRKLIESGTLEILNDTYVFIVVSGGGVEVRTHDGDVAVYGVYGIAFPSFKVHRGSYSVRYDVENRVLDVRVEGCSIELSLPRHLVTNVVVYLSGGGAKLVLDSPTLRKFVVRVSGGALDFEIGGVEGCYAKFLIEGGSVRGSIAYAKYSGVSELLLRVRGGAVDIYVSIPRDTKLCYTSSLSGGVVNVELNGVDLSSPYYEIGYESATSKLHIDAEIAGGIVNVEVSR